MKVLYEVQQKLKEPIYGHPSREDYMRIERLENIVQKLAMEIDLLDLSKIDKEIEP